jgi:hypothetical protein
MKERIALVTQMDPFVGKYFSTEYLRKSILLQTEQEYKDIDKQIKKDIKSGLALNPVDVNNLDLMSQQNSAMQPELQQMQSDDSFEKQQQSADADMKRNQEIAKSQPKQSNSNK